MREIITTSFEVAGLVTLVAAVTVLLWPLSVAAALGACGGLLLVCSGVVTLAAPKRPRRREDELT